MATHVNSAWRLHETLAHARAIDGKKKCLDVWAAVFEIEEEDKNRKIFYITECIQLLHQEIETVMRQMKSTDFTQTLYSKALSEATNVIAVHALMGQWESLRVRITPELLLSLQYCSEILPDEEDEIEPVDLESVSELIEQLEGMLAESSLPAHVKELIERNIIQIRSALVGYRVAGVSRLEDTLQQAYGQVILNESTFEENKDAPEIKNLARVWRKLQDICREVNTTQQGIESTQKIVTGGVKALEFLDKVLNG